jgi:uncharacterized protein involved in oxidation of intracellular sulfur
MQLGIIISSNDSETVWNAFRLANFSALQNDSVRIFLIGKGVEAEEVSNEKFDIKSQMKLFVDSGMGVIFACGSCFKIRNSEGTELCPMSSMKDLHDIIKKSDKIITF